MKPDQARYAWKYEMLSKEKTSNVCLVFNEWLEKIGPVIEKAKVQLRNKVFKETKTNIWPMCSRIIQHFKTVYTRQTDNIWNLYSYAKPGVLHVHLPRSHSICRINKKCFLLFVFICFILCLLHKIFIIIFFLIISVKQSRLFQFMKVVFCGCSGNKNKQTVNTFLGFWS